MAQDSDISDLLQHYRVRDTAVVRVLLRRVVGGAPITVLRQHIEQQDRPA